MHKEKVPLREGDYTHFDIVKHPGGAVILAINNSQKVCMLKQWRHAIGQSIWELPAGCLEPGEPPMNTAKRELEEEAGVVANQWSELGTIVPSPGFSNEVLYLFKATDIHPGHQLLDDAEQLEVHWIDLATVQSMASNGQIIDAKTLAALLRYSDEG